METQDGKNRSKKTRRIEIARAKRISGFACLLRNPFVFLEAACRHCFLMSLQIETIFSLRLVPLSVPVQCQTLDLYTTISLQTSCAQEFTQRSSNLRLFPHGLLSDNTARKISNFICMPSKLYGIVIKLFPSTPSVGFSRHVSTACSTQTFPFVNNRHID